MDKNKHYMSLEEAMEQCLTPEQIKKVHEEPAALKPAIDLLFNCMEGCDEPEFSSYVLALRVLGNPTVKSLSETIDMMDNHTLELRNKIRDLEERVIKQDGLLMRLKTQLQPMIDDGVELKGIFAELSETSVD